MNHIPDDIVSDVLSKLPSRSILRFKAVCKSWYALFSNPQFLHLHHSKKPSPNPKILFSTSVSHIQIQVLDYETLSFSNSYLSPPPPRGIFHKHAKIIGSSCGLVCVAVYYSDNYRLFIWNPLTGERRSLPNLGCDVFFGEKFYFHGLGYDSVANDFKLVISRDRRMRCNVFSLKANSWKRITCPLDVKYYHPGPYAIQPWGSLATVLNGVFHWLVVPNRINHWQIEILAFDVGHETFKKLQLSGYVQWKSSVVSLFEHRGCLCVSISKVKSCVEEEIWMMKEYGGWVHWLTVKNSLRFDCFQVPIVCISTRGEVIYRADRKFERCGMEEEDKLDELCIKSCMYGMVLYVETLVSPYADDGLQLHIKQRPMLQGNGIESQDTVEDCFENATGIQKWKRQRN